MNIEIVKRICAINRRALYDGMPPAKERAIAKFWRLHHIACVGA